MLSLRCLRMLSIGLLLSGLTAFLLPGADDVKNGKVVEAWPNGKTKVEAIWKQGVLHGKYAAFREDGTVEHRCNYVNGRIQGLYWAYHASGKLKSCSTYVNGVRNGRHTEYAADGSTITKVEFIKPKGSAAGATSAPGGGQTRTAPGVFAGNPHLPVDVRADFWRSQAEIHAEVARIKANGQAAAAAPLAAPAAAAGVMPLPPAQLNAALTQLKIYRFLANVPYADITLKDVYNDEAQHAAALLKILGRLTHHPKKPDGVSDEFFKKAKNGCGRGNLAMSSRGMTAAAAVNMWMFDSDRSNMHHVGHRRWCLNPRMQQTGFGAAGSFAVIWAHDGKRTNVPDYDFVSWPSRGYHPAQAFGKGWCWSVSPNPAKYAKLDKSVKAVLTQLDARYQKTGDPVELEHHTVSKTPYGQAECVIFRPKDANLTPGARYMVEIQGVKSRGGQDALIQFRVEFY